MPSAVTRLPFSAARVATFEEAWHRHVGPGRALYSRDPKAIGLVELLRGENPLASETQLRTLWT